MAIGSQTSRLDPPSGLFRPYQLGLVITISAGVTSSAVVGTLIGVGAPVVEATNHSPVQGPGLTGSPSVAAAAAQQLPFTGVSHLALLVAVGLILIMAGVLLLGSARTARHDTA